RQVVLEDVPPIVIAGRHHAAVGDRGAVAGQVGAIATGRREDREVRVLIQLLAVYRALARRVLRRIVVAVVGAVWRDARWADADGGAVELLVIVVVRIPTLVVVVDREAAIQLVHECRTDHRRQRAGRLPRRYRVVRFAHARGIFIDADVVLLI